MANLIKDIIWDFDGTLFDTYPGIVYSFKQALKDIGINESDEKILDFMKISEGCAIANFKEVYGINDDFIDKYTNYKKHIKPEMVTPFPFAAEICKQFMASGGRNYIITHRGESTFKFLEHYGMIGYFTEVITKQNGFKRKPDPEAFIYLIEKYQINRSTAVVVGDREIEILGGKAAGIKTCLYNTNKVALAVTPDFCIDALEDLKEILNI